MLLTLLGLTKNSTSRGVRSSDRLGHSGATQDAVDGRKYASSRTSGLAAGPAAEPNSKPTPRRAAKPIERPSYWAVHVVDSRTFEVQPDWVWSGRSGSRVRIANFDPREHPEPGGRKAKKNLTELIRGKKVELGTIQGIHHGTLVCDVYKNGVILTQLLSS